MIKNLMKEGAILTKRIKNANAPMIFGEKEAKDSRELQIAISVKNL